jgi:hypothetical protein
VPLTARSGFPKWEMSLDPSHFSLDFLHASS